MRDGFDPTTIIGAVAAVRRPTEATPDGQRVGVWRYTVPVESAADERRARMQVRVYPSLRAHSRDDRAHWAALSVDVRVLQVWQLSEEQWRMRGEFPDEPGLCRSVTRVHRP